MTLPAICFIFGTHLFLLWIAYDIGFDRGYNEAKGWDCDD